MNNLIKSLNFVMDQYNKAWLNDKAKYEFVRKVTAGNGHLAEFLLCKSGYSEENLKETIVQYVNDLLIVPVKLTV